MSRREREIWPERPGAHEDAAPETAPVRRKDTDLSEPSVRKSRRQIREEEAAGLAPWDDLTEIRRSGTAYDESGYGGAGSRGSRAAATGGREGRRSDTDPSGTRRFEAETLNDRTRHFETGFPGGRRSETMNAGATGAGAGTSDRGHEDEAGGKAEERRKPRSNTLASVLSGNILSQSEVRRAYPYMVFVACLMFLYIANVFRTQYIYRQHAELTEQVKELRAKSMTIASERMQATQQSNIMVELERRGIPLRESLLPNKVIPNPHRDGKETNDR